jgi:hypothetical protein
MMTHSDRYRRILYRMGYYPYQRGLIDNHLIQEGGWESHLQNCRNFTLSAIELYNPSSIAVLGSGWLLDLPLAEILEKGIEVKLVDIVHPPEVIKQTEDLKGVQLLESDITGGLIGEVWNQTRGFGIFRKLRTLERIRIPEYDPPFGTEMLISLNILTQLESRLLVWLGSRSRISDEETMRFRLEIQNRHVSLLKRHRSVLISDYSEVFKKSSGDQVVRTLFAELPEGDLKDEWTWNYDLKGRDNYTSKSVMKVTARAF